MQTINPTHFIEQVRYYDGDTRSFSPLRIDLMKWSLKVTANRDSICTTIAIFKIYPKVKPVLAHYDYDLKTTIVQ